MDTGTFEEYLEQGEGTEVEFKESHTELSDSAFESICAFLNRNGGHLFLGVNDDGEVVGIEENNIQDILDTIVTCANNPEKLHPPCYLSPEVIEYEDQTIIHVHVPKSSQVHTTAGEIFDRSEDGDLNVTRQSEHVRKMHLRKDSTYSENEIYPGIELSHFKDDLFQRIKALARSENPDHPWLELDNEELLRSAGLYRHDYQTGEEGYTLASVLLLGEDEVIRDVLPHYKTDAILRADNPDRYDDRDIIKTNLIESYDRLMKFVDKHLPDKFHQEGDQRINLRDRIFREIVSNLLIHREFTNSFPAKFVIEADRVFTENWNIPRNSGVIDPDQFSPYPKNPTIATFFNEIGRADELGSGVRNTYKYCRHYTPGTEPEFIEDDIFRAIIPLVSSEEFDENVGRKLGEDWEEVGKKLGETWEEMSQNEKKVFTEIYEDPEITIKELSNEIGISTTAVENNIGKLKEKEVIDRIGSTKAGSWKVLI